MARKHLKAGVLTAPLPPVMVTVGKGEEVNVLTIAWTGILSTNPPRTYISVRPTRHSYEILRREREFVINLASADMARTVDYVGIYTGAKVDKFKECGLSTTPSREVQTPTIAECPFAVECRVLEIIPMGTHDVFVADIVSVSCDEEMIDSDGKLRFDKMNLLAYAHGEYYKLGECVGRFGFSTKKPTKRRQGMPKTERAEQDMGARKSEEEPPRVEKCADFGGEGEKKPFYLSAPRGKGRRKGVKRK